jgi:SET domain-containing protein
MKKQNRGVFANAKIAKGQVVCDYNGVLTEREKHIRKVRFLEKTRPREAELIKGYALDLPDSADFNNRKIWTIEAHQEDEPQSFGRLINHSATKTKVPGKSKRFRHFNLATRVKRLGGRLRVLFIAERDIGNGEQLLWDYGPHYRDKPWYNSCPCEQCKM